MPRPAMWSIGMQAERREMKTEEHVKSFPAQLALFGVMRTLMSTGFRMVYPFLPMIARGLGVNLETIALAVTGRFLLGLSSPFLGSFADFRGRKNCMLMGALIYSASFMAIVLWPSLPGLWIALLVSAMGKIIFDPALQAYLGDQVDYGRRGRAVAITELGWSSASLFGIPLCALLIARAGWQAPFPWLAGLIALAALGILLLIPSDGMTRNRPITLIRGLRNLLRQPRALAAIPIGALISSGNEAITIVYGAWMEQAFMINILALGAATAVIGVAELSGEGMVALFTDRLGVRRAIAIGIILNICSALVLPFFGKQWLSALLGLFLFFITFEFAIVSSIPLISELMPDARATMMSTYFAGMAAGRALGSLAGSLLFGAGIYLNALFTATVDLLALVLLLRFIRD